MRIKAPQRPLLDALLLPPPEAEAAWRTWRASADLDLLDNGSFQLLPALAGRMPAWLACDPQRRVLMGLCRRAWSENQVQRKLLADTVQVLGAAGIHRVAATGPLVWAALYWPEGAIRPIGKVDVLLEPSVVRHAFDVLSQAGWTTAKAIPDVSGKGFPFSPGVLLQSPSGGHLHLHWRALPNTDLSLRRPEFPPLEALPPGLGAPYTVTQEDALIGALGGAHEDGIPWYIDALIICRHPGLLWNKVADLLKRRSAPRNRLDELWREFGIEIPRAVTTPEWKSNVEQILASMLRAYRRSRIGASD